MNVIRILPLCWCISLSLPLALCLHICMLCHCHCTRKQQQSVNIVHRDFLWLCVFFSLLVCLQYKTQQLLFALSNYSCLVFYVHWWICVIRLLNSHEFIFVCHAMNLRHSTMNAIRNVNKWLSAHSLSLAAICRKKSTNKIATEEMWREKKKHTHTHDNMEFVFFLLSNTQFTVCLNKFCYEILIFNVI